MKKPVGSAVMPKNNKMNSGRGPAGSAVMPNKGGKVQMSKPSPGPAGSGGGRKPAGSAVMPKNKMNPAGGGGRKPAGSAVMPNKGGKAQMSRPSPTQAKQAAAKPKQQMARNMMGMQRPGGR